jgi:uncharacterized protein YqiB (DUF1249 family)
MVTDIEGGVLVGCMTTGRDAAAIRGRDDIVLGMFVTIAETGVVLVEPRSFTGLMSLYETNHVRLRRLLGDPGRLPDELVTVSPHDLPLHVRVLERAPYTAVLHLTYWFPEPGALRADPDLTVRVYRDAKLVEACACTPRPHHRALSPYALEGRGAVEQRWIMNVMLGKWLDYLIGAGHAVAGRVPRGP